MLNKTIVSSYARSSTTLTSHLWNLSTKDNGNNIVTRHTFSSQQFCLYLWLIIVILSGGGQYRWTTPPDRLTAQHPLDANITLSELFLRHRNRTSSLLLYGCIIPSNAHYGVSGHMLPLFPSSRTDRDAAVNGHVGTNDLADADGDAAVKYFSTPLHQNNDNHQAAAQVSAAARKTEHLSWFQQLQSISSEEVDSSTGRRQRIHIRSKKNAINSMTNRNRYYINPVGGDKLATHHPQYRNNADANIPRGSITSAKPKLASRYTQWSDAASSLSFPASILSSSASSASSSSSSGDNIKKFKEDYDQLLRENGWTRQQLASISRDAQSWHVIYLDHDHIQLNNHPNITAAHHYHNMPPVDKLTGLGQYDDDDLGQKSASNNNNNNGLKYVPLKCPLNITLRLGDVMLGKLVKPDQAIVLNRIDLMLNPYVHSPDLRVNSINNIPTRKMPSASTRAPTYNRTRSRNVRLQKSKSSAGSLGDLDKEQLDECYYQLSPQDETPFGSYSINIHGQLMANLQTAEISLVITPLTGSKMQKSRISDGTKDGTITILRHPYLIYAPKLFSASNQAVSKNQHHNCGSYTGEKSWRSVQQLRTARRQSVATLYSSRGHRHAYPSNLSFGLNRSPRDIRLQTKWIELALIIDTNLVKILQDVHREPLEMALHLTNLLDQIYQPLKTRVMLSYLEVWSVNNQMHITSDSSTTLLNLMSYSTEHLYGVTFDTLQLITANGRGFTSAEVGVASLSTVCTLKSVGVVNIASRNSVAGSVDLLQMATDLAHMIAHNLGIHHDEQDVNTAKDHNSALCLCPHDIGCVMKPSLLNEGNGYRPLLSSCSQDDYFEALHMGQGTQCLINSPFQEAAISAACGNGVVDAGEDCDCGGFMACLGKGSCCDAVTCRFKEGAECADGPCCTHECRMKREGSLCRSAKHDCDLAEYCTGKSSECPANGFKKNGQYCGNGRSYCFNHTCQHLDGQCAAIWGTESKVAATECYQRFNAEGMFNGHCGLNQDGTFRQCEPKDLFCGTIQCTGGQKIPALPFQHRNQQHNSMPHTYAASSTVITASGKQVECKTRTTVNADPAILKETAMYMLAMNGTKCDTNKICISGRCVDVAPYIQPGNCPSSNAAIMCSGNGICNDLNQCSCHPSYIGLDCAQRANRYILNETDGKFRNTGTVDMFNLKRSIIPENKATADANELLDNFMIPLIMAALIGMFLMFFLLALFCYNRKTEHDDVYFEDGHDEDRDDGEDDSGLHNDGNSYDTSPMSLKPPVLVSNGTILRNMGPNGSLPRNLSTNHLNPDKLSLLSETGTYHSYTGSVEAPYRAAVGVSPVPPKPSCSPVPARVTQKDVAVSPYIKRRVIPPTSGLLNPYPCTVCVATGINTEERLSDEWTSVSDELPQPPVAFQDRSLTRKKEKMTELTYIPPYRHIQQQMQVKASTSSKPDQADDGKEQADQTTAVKGRVRIKNFEQLLKQLGDVNTSAATQKHANTEPQQQLVDNKDTKDIALQVNFDVVHLDPPTSYGFYNQPTLRHVHYQRPLSIVDPANDIPIPPPMMQLTNFARLLTPTGTGSSQRSPTAFPVQRNIVLPDNNSQRQTTAINALSGGSAAVWKPQVQRPTSFRPVGGENRSVVYPLTSPTKRRQFPVPTTTAGHMYENEGSYNWLPKNIDNPGNTNNWQQQQINTDQLITASGHRSRSIEFIRNPSPHPIHRSTSRSRQFPHAALQTSFLTRNQLQQQLDSDSD